MREKICRVDEGNRVPLKIPLMDGLVHPEQGPERSPEPLCLPRLDAARPESIHVLQHPQLGEVLVNLENPSYKIQVCFTPLETNVKSSSDDLMVLSFLFHEGNRVPFMRKNPQVDEGNRVPLRSPSGGTSPSERDGGRRSPEPLFLSTAS